MPTMLHKGILGKKLGMTRVFLENGDAVACTLVFQTLPFLLEPGVRLALVLVEPVGHPELAS